MNLQEELKLIKDYEFDFENLAFEGGGVKIAGYIGAIKVLEVLGILKNCRGFAGTSGGSMFATLLAVNCDAEFVRNFMLKIPVNKLVTDSTLGKAALPINIVRKFGWNPANGIYECFREVLKTITGNADITFKQVYEKYGKILCLTGTNISTQSLDYFHPKTTPDFSVALAVRVSLGLPGYMQPVCTKTTSGVKQYLTDGGLVCNFPIHVFDGWFLSMDQENSFFNKIGASDPFGEFNRKTLGFVLCTPYGGEYMQGEIQARLEQKDIMRPKTPLAKLRAKKCEKNLARNVERQRVMDAARRFLALLREYDEDNNFQISLDEFKKAFDRFSENQEDVNVLFGKDFNWGHAFLEMDADNSGEITFNEFMQYLQNKGIDFMAILEGGNMVEIGSFGEYLESVLNTVLGMTRRVYSRDCDVMRTAGIYTDYIDTADFTLLDVDKKFLINQGIMGTIAYFQYLVKMYEEGSLPDCMAGSVKERFDNNTKSTDNIAIAFEDQDDVDTNEVTDSENSDIKTVSSDYDLEFGELQFENLDKSRGINIVFTAIATGMLVFVGIGIVIGYFLFHTVESTS